MATILYYLFIFPCVVFYALIGGALYLLWQLFLLFIKLIFWLGCIVINLIIRKSQSPNTKNKKKSTVNSIYELNTKPKNNNIFSNSDNAIIENSVNGISNESMRKTINTNESAVYLHIYIKKKYHWLRKHDELNYEILQIPEKNRPDVYLEDDEDEVYYTFEAEDYTSRYFVEILEKAFAHCKEDMYATLSYGTREKVKYKYIYQNGKPVIENADESIVQKKYYLIKEYIKSSFNEMEEHIYFNIKDDEFFTKVIKNLDIIIDDIEDLSKDLDNTPFSIFRLSFLEEMHQIIKEIKPQIIEKGETEYRKETEWMDDFFDPGEPIYEEPLPVKQKESKKKEKKNELSWEDEEFEREADLWELTEEDRRIAKAEGMTPADFDEAEDRNDDELLYDDWNYPGNKY